MALSVYTLLCKLCLPNLSYRNTLGLDVPVYEQMAATFRYLLTGRTIATMAATTCIQTLQSDRVGTNEGIYARSNLKLCFIYACSSINVLFFLVPTMPRWIWLYSGKFWKKTEFALKHWYNRQSTYPSKSRIGEETNLKNYKKFISVVWLAVVNAECEVIFSNIGSPGRLRDSRIYATSDLETLVKRMPPVNVSGPQGIAKYVIVGDKAF